MEKCSYIIFHSCSAHALGVITLKVIRGLNRDCLLLCLLAALGCDCGQIYSASRKTSNPSFLILKIWLLNTNSMSTVVLTVKTMTEMYMRSTSKFTKTQQFPHNS